MAGWTLERLQIFLFLIDLDIYLCRQLLLLLPRRICDNRSLSQGFYLTAMDRLSKSNLCNLGINCKLCDEPLLILMTHFIVTHPVFAQIVSLWLVDFLVSHITASDWSKQFLLGGKHFETAKVEPTWPVTEPPWLPGEHRPQNLLQSSLFLPIMYQEIMTFPLKGS